ncbi:MAG: hypothetical protein AB7O67_08695 [Vicinamibacterales bacterium]
MRPLGTSVVGRAALVSLFLLGGAFVQPALAAAADGQDRPAPEAQPAGVPLNQPDFFFARPHAAISLRGGWLFAGAGSDLFDFVTEQLTIDKGDFNAPAFDADLAFPLSNHLEAVVGFNISKVSHLSEYRDFVDNQLLPIEQTTTLTTRAVQGGVRYTLAPRGRNVSRFAWVPSRVVPYLGAGGGVVWYDFVQGGDFVDFVDLSIFSSRFRSTGWTPSVHAIAGADIQLYRRLYLSMQGQYQWAAADLGEDFVDFEPIDLSGFRVSTGVTLVF